MQTTLVWETKNLSASKKLLLDRFSELEEVSTSGAMNWKLISQKPVGNIVAYRSGKLVIQSGNVKWARRILSMLSRDDQADFVPHIGVDETGKGDFFGPLVTCALFVPSKEVAGKLRQFGVRDSKGISDSTIESMHKNITKLCPDHSLVIIGPKKLSEMLEESKNINKVLAWAHSTAIENVIEKSDEKIRKVVIDQFSRKKGRITDAIGENGNKLEIVQKHGGESDVAVAAASIVARATFVSELDKLSNKYGMIFPKGASDVIDAAKQFVKQNGKKELNNVAKTTFKITQQI